MDHKIKTGMEGALLFLGLALLNYAAEHVDELLSGDRHTFLAGALTTALVATGAYVKARYAAPPNVQEKIDSGVYPEQRDLATRQDRAEKP